MKLASPFARNSLRGASSSIYLCFSEEVADLSGEYFYDCKIGKLTSAALNDENCCQTVAINRRFNRNKNLNSPTKPL